MVEKKLVTVAIPCYNEEGNVRPMYEAVRDLFEQQLPQYDWNLQFIDNASTDSTKAILEEICGQDMRVRCIFNARNFGPHNSPFYNICQAGGDCIISMCCDFEDPVELIPSFLEEWEKGYKIVCGVYRSCKVGFVKKTCRRIYYRLIKSMSEVQQIDDFTGYGLYDRSFIDFLNRIDDPRPLMRNLVAEFGTKVQMISYDKQPRRSGFSHNRINDLYDMVMLSVTNYTKTVPRLATFIGVGGFAISLLTLPVFAVLKYGFSVDWFSDLYWIMLFISLFGFFQVFLIGVLGEYVMNINTRIMHRPLVIEERRLNFESETKKE